ncbi:MAG: tetratricopeptide repeat protein [Acidobacteriia bacterium]|nr:tetratricopeptide repeat protein [Terriglobia bacterium]
MKRIAKLGMRAVLLVAALLCVMAPRAAAQMDGVIRGQIMDVAGKPWQSLAIQAVSEQGVKADTKTDEKGYFVIRGLRSGIYTVNIMLPNQQPFVVQVRVASGQDGIANVNFKDVVAKQGAEYAEATKKQEEEKQKFEGMKAHFAEGTRILEQVRLAKADLQKLPPGAPADQKDAAKQKLADLSAQAASEFTAAQKSAPEKDPNQHLLWAKLGEAYDLGGRNDDAINAYQQAITAFEPVMKEKPEAGAGYYNNLGNVLARAGKVEEAHAAYLKSVELFPANAATAWRNFGIVLYNANRLKEAVEPLKKATELDPKSAQAWYLLGAALVGSMEYKQVGDKMQVTVPPGTTEAYEKALELDPNGVYGQQAKQGLEMLQQIAPGIQTKFSTGKKKKP